MPLRDIAGHPRTTALLVRSIARGTLPPSLIFGGDAGAGKRATAVAVAQALNCLEPRDGDACGRCVACQRIERGFHPDVLVIEPNDNGNIKIEPVREAIERSSYRPFEGRRRVVIIDDADLLVASAQNALLKTLEEPSASSVFILVTTRPDVLLPTVRSRCIRLTFRSDAGVSVDDEAGAVGERVLAQVVASGSRVGQKLEAAKTLLDSTGVNAASDREQVAAHLRAMASLLRDMQIVTVRADAAAIANVPLRPSIDRLAPSFEGDRGVRAFGAIAEALAAIKANVGIKIVADWLVLQL